MKFTETALTGAYVIDLEPFADSRGLFARTFCVQEFEAHGLNPTVAQCNLSVTRQRGALRGMHYQIAPAAETKLVRCSAGAIYDIIIDLRPDSPTYLQHFGVELSATNRSALYIPAGFAHGFQTLVDHTEVLYQMGEFYAPEYARGLRYDDPAFGLSWPLPVSEISQKDQEWPLWRDRADANLSAPTPGNSV